MTDLKNPYGVKNPRGQWVTAIREVWKDASGRPVWTWRTDPDQPPLKMTRLKAQEFVQYLHADPDIDGYTIHHLVG
jgi:hypothetical protein